MASHPTDFLLNGNNLGTAEMREVRSECYQPEAVEGEVVAVIIGPSGSGKWPQRFVRQLTTIHEPTNIDYLIDAYLLLLPALSAGVTVRSFRL